MLFLGLSCNYTGIVREEGIVSPRFLKYDRVMLAFSKPQSEGNLDISIIVATDQQGVIGAENALPWHIPADLRHFRQITMGKPLIMGRHTHESIGRALPGRTNIIITRDRNYQRESCCVVHSLEEAWAVCQGAPEVMVMGGASLYQQCLPLAQRIYLTLIHTSVEGDTRFPDLDKTQWREVAREDHLKDADNVYDYSFLVYERHT